MIFAALGAFRFKAGATPSSVVRCTFRERSPVFFARRDQGSDATAMLPAFLPASVRTFRPRSHDD